MPAAHELYSARQQRNGKQYHPKKERRGEEKHLQNPTAEQRTENQSNSPCGIIARADLFGGLYKGGSNRRLRAANTSHKIPAPIHKNLQSTPLTHRSQLPSPAKLRLDP